jgi:aminoglycoside 6-adenylyltransferase
MPAADHSRQDESGYPELEECVRCWAQEQPEIQAIVVVGSRARQIYPADQWSDLDLVAFTDKLSSQLTNPDFPKLFGYPLLSVLELTGQNDPEWLIVFENGLKLDIVLIEISAILSTSYSLRDWIINSPYQTVFKRGFRILVDKSEMSAHWNTLSPWENKFRPPGADTFEQELQSFFMECLRGAKYLRRLDLWRAQQVCDCLLKQRLLKLIEWHAQTLRQEDLDTWHDGRFLADWADPQILARLPETYGGFNRVRLRNALWASFDLGCSLARQEAESWNLFYPIEREVRTRQLLDQILMATQQE